MTVPHNPLSAAIEHRSDSALVEVPLADWRRSLAAIPRLPDHHPDSEMVRDLQLGSQRAGAVQTVCVIAGQVRAVLALLTPPADPAPVPDAEPAE